MPLTAPSTSARVLADTERLRTALRERDLPLALASYRFFTEIGAKRLFNMATEADVETTLRPWIEAWDDVLQLWWFAAPPAGTGSGQRTPWERFVTASRGEYEFRNLFLMPLWLRLARSDRLNRPGTLEPLGDLDFAEQSKALARFCLRSDSGQAIDFAATADQLDESLQPFWAQWFLTVYLVSPVSNVDETVNQNCRRAATDFAEFYRRKRVPLVPDLLLAHAGYRSVYFEDQPLPFLKALSDNSLGPVFAQFLRKARKPASPTKKSKKDKNRKRPARPSSAKRKAKGSGIVLGCWGEHQSVRRCMDPLLSQVRADGLRAYFFEGEQEDARKQLAGEWQAESVRLTCQPAVEFSEMASAAARIESHGLDFLFYPEIGLSGPTRWLATQRLARVQATGYGHPVTSGSANIDYFVGGRELETDAKRYRERLVLIPGLGVGSTPPPKPTRERTRPLDGDGVRFVSLATKDKLHAQLLKHWDSVLDASGAQVALEMMLGMSPVATLSATREIGEHMQLDRLVTPEAMPRAHCLNRLLEADVYLDSYPFGGFNSVIDALSVGLPVVTLESPSAYGRSGPAMLRMLGLPDFLVATNEAEYMAAAVRLANDPILRADIRAMLGRERVLEVFCGEEPAAHFAAAVEWMREQGPNNPGPPIVIEAGEEPYELEN